MKKIKVAITSAGMLFTAVASAEVVFLGVGSSSGLINNPVEMHDICRRSFAAQEIEFGNVRWASTRDYREASNTQGWGGDPAHLTNIDQVAFRAEDTIFTQDGRAYDQATGALAALEKNKYPGAVVIKLNEAQFVNKKTRVNPMCVRGITSGR